jgi:hypothetical protein
VYPRSSVYHRIHGWESFEPWLSRLETLNANQLWAIAEAVPPAWYGGDITTIERLMEQLLHRRTNVRDLITAFKNSTRDPFPNWNKPVVVPVPASFPALVSTPKFVM